MSNERNTENLVRDMLREQGYYDDPNIKIEEQVSTDNRIKEALASASKSGKGPGKPEFIVQFLQHLDDIIIIECKADVNKHESESRNKYKDYAVDGVLWYAERLKDKFNVTAIAVSGENEREKKVSTFIWLKGNYAPKDVQDKILIKPSDIKKLVDDYSKGISEKQLNDTAIKYNSHLHEQSIPEKERCTLISAVLVALQDGPFFRSYGEYENNQDLIKGLIEACERVLKKNGLDDRKTEVVIGEYSKFKNNSDLSSQTISKTQETNTILKKFIRDIQDDILPFIKNNQFDILGRFYTQFIRYAGDDSKTGLVLTPVHITDFFCDISKLTEDDVVFDPCCGTAGFLVSAMKYMLKKAGNDSDKHKKVKSIQLLGIEKRSDMFAHACSNMMMSGDGKSSILYGDCFDTKNKELIRSKKPTRGFLNPPYKGGNAHEQLEFVENTLECLEKSGICVAICQMSTCISNKKIVENVRQRLLEKHTLKAVFSMPNDLFHPIGVITSILVFEAHTPHDAESPTFFGYFKDDGFIKHKKHGRIEDKDNKWNGIKKEWLNAYRSSKSIPGLSVLKNVDAKDEWCAEAYMETDYTKLTEEDFEKTLRNYVAFQVQNQDF